MFKRSMRAVAAAAVLGAAVLPPPVQAQPKNVSAQPSPKALELSARLMKAMRIEEQVDSALQHMLPITAESEEFNALPAAARSMLLDTVREVMRDSVTPKLMKRMTPAYAAAFSEKELEAAVAFYESDAGQSMLSKTPQLMQASAAAVRDLMPDAQAEVMRRICEKVDCKGEAPKRS